MLFSIETHITCDFPVGGPSGSAHGTGTCASQETGTVYPGNEANQYCTCSTQDKAS